MREVVAVGAARTAIGVFGGALKDLSVVTLGSLSIREALLRARLRPQTSTSSIELSHKIANSDLDNKYYMWDPALQEVKIDEVNLDKEFIVEGDIVKNDAIDINKGLKYDEDYIDNFEGERKLVEKSSEINNEIKSTNNSSISEIEKLLLIDPENDDKNKNVYSMLMKMREKQNVVKKE